MRDRLEAALQRDTMPQMLLGVNYSFCHCVDTLLLFYQEKQQKNSGTHDDQSDEVDPVPEGMCVLYVVHNVYPSCQADHL